ncbi:uncharacterized protein LOC142560696 isoform X2 [Dermacentor variabilis]|uniref:uncharacterized protein LOC142560696 isoform X2 n=1 Tax=Dermacentor variabilis TaxID=34621 RepID=UPI003F5B53CE
MHTRWTLTEYLSSSTVVCNPLPTTLKVLCGEALCRDQPLGNMCASNIPPASTSLLLLRMNHTAPHAGDSWPSLNSRICCFCATVTMYAKSNSGLHKSESLCQRRAVGAVYKH